MPYEVDRLKRRPLYIIIWVYLWGQFDLLLSVALVCVVLSLYALVRVEYIGLSSTRATATLFRRFVCIGCFVAMIYFESLERRCYWPFEWKASLYPDGWFCLGSDFQTEAHLWRRVWLVNIPCVVRGGSIPSVPVAVVHLLPNLLLSVSLAMLRDTAVLFEQWYACAVLRSVASWWLGESPLRWWCWSHVLFSVGDLGFTPTNEALLFSNLYLDRMMYMILNWHEPHHPVYLSFLRSKVPMCGCCHVSCVL